MVIRVLVVDDSAFMRKLLREILSRDSSIEVVDTAFNGRDAVNKTKRLQPDVITMDIEMPIMNGIEAVREIMKEQPTPIVMVSALTTKGAETTIEALQAGAVDFICKPSGSISPDLDKISDELISKVKAASHAKIKHIYYSLSSADKISVLIVDDSSLIRKYLRDAILSTANIQVIGEASNGREAVDKVVELKPDVIIMDIEMPVMNGVEATFEILKNYSIPIIVFSGKTNDEMKDVKLALEIGAVDFLPKPTDHASLRTTTTLLIRKIREVVNQPSYSQKKIVDTEANIENILLIGSSTGGPQTLAELIPRLPRDIPAGILIVQHMPPVFTKSLAERLDKISSISVREAKDGDEIQRGVALVAPGDYHMVVEEKIVNGEKKRYVSLNKDEKIHGVRPAVDITFSSAANVFGSNAIGVLLTGMGQDGAHSMGLIKAKGGYTIAQDEETSIIFGMPAAAIKLGAVDDVAPIHKIPSLIINKLSKQLMIKKEVN